MCASACHAMPMVDGLWMGCAPTTHVCVSWHTCVHQTAHTAGERCLYLETACVCGAGYFLDTYTSHVI